MYVQQGYVFGLVCLYVIKNQLFGVSTWQKYPIYCLVVKFKCEK